MITLGITIYTHLEHRKYKEEVKKEIQTIAQETQKTLLEEIEPLKIAVSRSMGIIGQKGHNTQKLKRAEKYLAQDLIDSQDPLILAGLNTLSPDGRFREYIEKNPDLILQLIPRLQALSKIEGFNPMDLIKPPDDSSRGRTWKNHPLLGLEE